ncbi:hypothetical protein E4A63_00140 [Salmonella enterica subsp. enterica serovar Ank]|nr:hypothetical protein [Salmonella enterica subsp. enterica serovar Ank]
MLIKSKSDLAPGITANKSLPTPEQMMVVYTELEAVVDKADRNTRHNQKAQALEPVRSWINAGKRRAMEQINKRGAGANETN